MVVAIALFPQRLFHFLSFCSSADFDPLVACLHFMGSLQESSAAFFNYRDDFTSNNGLFRFRGLQVLLLMILYDLPISYITWVGKQNGTPSQEYVVVAQVLHRYHVSNVFAFDHIWHLCWQMNAPLKTVV